MDFLTADFLKALTPWSVILVLVIMNFLGWIRPKRAVDEARADRDARLVDKDKQIDTWREAYFASEAAREKDREATREALEVARAAEAALEGFRAATSWADRERGGPGA